MVSKYEVFGRFADRCESPIERLFLVGLLFMGDYTFVPFEHDHVIARDATGIELGQQTHIGGYRADFTLTRPGAQKRYAVETDGFQFHGATPEQFERHSARQRAIVALGWTPLRFTGREVVRDPRRCAAEAMGAAAALVPSAEVDVPVSVKITPENAHLFVAVKPTSVDPEMDGWRSQMAEASDWDEQVRIMTEIQKRARARIGASRKVG